LADAERIDKFAVISSIDMIANSGNYTHDDVFMLDADFVKTLELLYYERAMYDQRRSDVRSGMHKKKE